MKLKLGVLGLAVVGAIFAARMTMVPSEPDEVGVAATNERLAAVRAAAPRTMGPCDPTGLCVANVACAPNGTGGCLNPGAACTNGNVNGAVQNKACKNTSTVYICGPVILQGCAQTNVGCESTNVGCTCTQALANNVWVGTVSSC